MKLLVPSGNQTNEITLNNKLVRVVTIAEESVSIEAGTVVICTSGSFFFTLQNQRFDCQPGYLLVVDRITAVTSNTSAEFLAIELQEPACFTPPRDIEQLFDTFEDTWSPRVAAETALYQVKLAKLLGEFVWHNHESTDELFVIWQGSLQLEFTHHKVVMESGSALCVPRGVEHLPIADELVLAVIVEPKGVVNTGNAGGELTAQNNVRV